VPDVLPEDTCFHTQQCAEKALKALLIARGIDFPRTHVVEALLDLLIAAGIDIPPELDEAVVLTQYAVQARYPGAWGPVTESEARFALQVAGWVLAWVEDQVS
jgi:HEPN domain-containing protein